MPKKNSIKDDTIVVVGMAANFAGCPTLDAYWNTIMGRHVRLGITQRWAGETKTAYIGGFLEDYADFDAGFFRISPNEARCMDPQQRLLLQVIQHAIDHSALDVPTLKELRCGLFTTSLPGDYKFLLAEHPEQAFSTYSFLGNAASSLSGRISYFYDFNGPSVTYDTACSSSLTALQAAILNLKAGTCSAALVGAASIFSTPELFRFVHTADMVSKQGRCAAFSEDADGFIPAEGVAAVLLMRASDAQTLGLRSYGAIEAIGVNHNGTSNGLMAPNSAQQAELITWVFKHHKIDPKKLAYVETHGTGTRLGDPLEIQGLTRALSRLSPTYNAYLGAVKPLIGHTLVCSGLASLIKVLLAFQNDTLPPFPQMTQPNTLIDFNRLQRSDTPLPWPETQPFAAVSAFGFTGTNAHVVLRKLPSTPEVMGTRSPRLPYAFAKKRYWIESAHQEISVHGERVVLTRLRQALADLLGFPMKDLTPQTSIKSLGLDSLSVLKVLGFFSSQGKKMQPHHILQFQTLADLAQALESPEEDTSPSVPAAATAASLSHLSWKTYGHGDPIFLLPPMNMAEQAWSQQTAKLVQQGRQVFIPLYPGHQGTSFDPHSFSFHSVAKHLSVFMEETTRHPVDIVGWSLGGCLGALIALEGSVLVRSLTIISAAPSFPEDVYERTVALHKDLESHADILTLLFDKHSLLESVSAGASLDVLKFYYEELMRFNIEDLLPKIAAKTFVVHGQQDCVIEDKVVAKWLTIPQSHALTLPDHGHFIPLTAPRTFNDTLQHFLTAA